MGTPAYVEALYGWDDFLHAGEQDVIAAMGREPDTTVQQAGGDALIYRDAQHNAARILVLSDGLLMEDMFIQYFGKPNDPTSLSAAQAFYDSTRTYFEGVHGQASFEVEDGALWNLTSAGATDSLRQMVETLWAHEQRADSSALTSLLADASLPDRKRLIRLLGAHRGERVYIGKQIFANIYTVTVSRSAGVRALWNDAYELVRLDAL